MQAVPDISATTWPSAIKTLGCRLDNLVIHHLMADKKMSKNITYAIYGFMIMHSGISFSGVKEDTEVIQNKKITDLIEKLQLSNQCKIDHIDLPDVTKRYETSWFYRKIKDPISRACECQVKIPFVNKGADENEREINIRRGYLATCKSIAYEAVKIAIDTDKMAKEKIAEEILAKNMSMREEAARVAEEAKRVAEEEKLIAQKKAEDARIAAEANRKKTEEKAVSDAGLVSDTAILWMNKSGLSKFSRGNIDPNEGFATLWYDAQDIARQFPKANVFTPPEKSEFETTDAYNKRIATLKSQFDADIKNLNAQNHSNWSKAFRGAINKNMRDPAIDDLRYDADRGVFLFSLASSNLNWSIPLKVEIPNTKAPAKKDFINSLDRIVVLFLNGDTLTVKGVTLVDPKTNLAAYIYKLNIDIPYKFNAQNYEKIAAIMKQRQARMQIEANAEAAAQAERDKKTTWYKALNKINVDGPLCENFRNRINLIRSSGMPDNEVNRNVLSTFSQAIDSGCVQN